MVATITSEGDDYAREVTEALRAKGMRAETDLRNEKINYKVREHSLQKVPVLIAVGKREVDERSVSIRRLGAKGQESLALEEAVRRLAADAERIDRYDPKEIETWREGIRFKEEWFFTQAEEIKLLSPGNRLMFQISGMFSVAKKAHRILHYQLGAGHKE